MEQYIYTLYEKKQEIKLLIDRINRSDKSLCDENWYSLTFHYDLDVIKFVFQHIEVEKMVDVVKDIIFKEFRSLEENGSPHFGVFKESIESYANRRRKLLALRRKEQEIRKQYSKKLKASWFTRIKFAFKTIMNRETPINSELFEEPHNAAKFDKDFAQLSIVSAALKKQEESMELEKLKDECESLKAVYNAGRTTIEILKKENEELRNAIIPDGPEQAFNPTGNECFTKAKMGLLIYTIASIVDGPIPIKKALVPIISAIGGWETTSVDIEMKKAGFNKKDIETLAELFKDAMPNFAAEIKKQAVRKPKLKK